MTLDDIFNEAMDELEARNPGKKDVNDVIKEILDKYGLSTPEQEQLTEDLLSNY